ncbi:unnamed protein product [Schistosoma rodhaini]|nr:unnamed protein product [Schistosoma rodhaini]
MHFRTNCVPFPFPPYRSSTEKHSMSDHHHILLMWISVTHTTYLPNGSKYHFNNVKVRNKKRRQLIFLNYFLTSKFIINADRKHLHKLHKHLKCDNKPRNKIILKPGIY